MSLAHDANPINWSGGLKAMAAVVAILGTLGAGTLTVGGKISDFSRVQTEMVDQIKGLAEKMADVRTEITKSAHEQDVAREREIGALQDQLSVRRSVMAPRIDKMENAVDKATADIASANARINDMQGSLDEIKQNVKDGLTAARENLSVSRSHDADIKNTRDDARATRAVVAPKPHSELETTPPPY